MDPIKSLEIELKYEKQRCQIYRNQASDIAQAFSAFNQFMKETHDITVKAIGSADRAEINEFKQLKSKGEGG